MTRIPQVSQVTATIGSTLRRNEASDGIAEVGGPQLDYLVLNGIKADGSVRIISGRPTRTTMNGSEVKQFLTDTAISVLKEAIVRIAQRHEALTHQEEIKTLLEQRCLTKVPAERKKIDELVRQLRGEAAEADPRERQKLRDEARDIRVTKDQILKSNRVKRSSPSTVLGSEVYVFGNDMVVHTGHTEFALVDYGKVNLQTGHVYIYGMLQELAEPIPVGGRKFHFYIFDPWDTREVEDGGVIRTLGLAHDERQALFDWVNRILRYTSYLKIDQQRIAILKERDALKDVLKDMQERIGEYVRVIEQLKTELVGSTTGLFSISQILVSMLISVGGLGMAGFGLGVLLASAFGSTVIDQPFYNDTSHVLLHIDHVVTPSPYAFILPGISALVGMFFGIMVSSRRWGKKRGNTT